MNNRNNNHRLNKGIKKYLHAFLFFALASFITFNTYNKNKPVSRKELVYISGKLQSAPIQGEQGGDMPEPYIKFEIEGSKKAYVIMWCSYETAFIDEILNLKKEDNVIIYHKNKDQKKKKIMIYEITNQNESLLKLEDYNKCYTRRWKEIIIFVYIIGLIIVTMFLIDLYKWLSR